METRVSTRVLPRHERFDFWQEMVERIVAPFEIHSDHTAEFDATIHAVEAGPLLVASFDQPGLEARRTARLIRRSDPDVYHLGLITRGTAWLVQGDRSAVLPAGTLVLVDSSRPYTNVLRAESGNVRGLTVSIPRGLLPVSARAAESLLATPMSGRTGTGALTAAHLSGLLAHAGQYSPLDTARLATVSLDLISALLSQRLDFRQPSQASDTRVLFERALAYIQHHLGDPALTPGRIAAAHNVSPRTLERLFRTHETTPAAWIRTRRLDRCRRDLSDPLLRERPIHATAARWGFASPANFTRTFRAAYGISPREWQQLTAVPEA
ncbi:helix-turn-helix domain-containing protein [Streptomyces sp. SID8377]|uniref:AraC-like ligand-binding domain-containing protein n=2 Tax=unclassified Streptomyces TaxID=2593676 RepID=UPI0003697073|nr:helix-turn-helix domain-containing protein [Streptomyces sp. SID8377]